MRCRELDIFKNLGFLRGNLWEIFWDFFGRNFLGGFFWEEFFGRKFLGGIFLGGFFLEEFFERNSLGGILYCLHFKCHLVSYIFKVS